MAITIRVMVILWFHVKAKIVLLYNLRNSAIIGSFNSAGSSDHLLGRALKRLTRPFAFGHVGKGHVVQRDRTALHLQVLQTRPPGGISSSDKPYSEACVLGSGLECV